ncbi:WD repeat-containing protein mio [Hypsibius exemplaris]|uniref:WD repeat-containing protein mio n=1 Tax=Hypsibius exemplaris TaxID=2072580 RepID=A0A1W0WR72_HYPEX|nr:WD repeat-containing protein mio [Hypsibius exemplaris]
MEILWSPYEDNIFARLSGENLTLFEVDKFSNRSTTPQSVELSHQTFASPIVSAVAPFYVRCLDWCPTRDFGRLLAVGSASGRIRIVGFQDPSTRDIFRKLLDKDYGPRHQRPCNALAWNHTDSHLIAVGLDRHRSDPSLLIYDIFTAQEYVLLDKGKEELHGGSSGTKSDGALYEFGAGEQVVSLCWIYSKEASTAKMLVGGFQTKGLRLFDLRDSASKPRGPSTKAVYGVCGDPFNEHRVASFSDNILHVWDMRSFDKPIATHESSHKAISQIQWSPTRYGLLGAVTKDSPDFRLLDLQHTHVMRDDHDPVLLERSFNATDGRAITSFSWHPHLENRVLFGTTTNTMHDVKVMERITLNWSKTHHLLWACGRETRYLSDISAPELVLHVINDDISMRMKIRATNGYGLNVDKFAENSALLAGDNRPEAMWTALDAIRNVEGLDSMDGMTFRGIRNVLAGETGKAKSTAAMSVWEGTPYAGRKDGVPIYTSNERDIILRLCGWSLNKDSTLESLLYQEQYERAAALCVFHFELRKAIEILQTASKKGENYRHLSIVAVALSGFTDDQPSLWRSLSSTITPEIEEPYLRAVLLFLSSSRSEGVLKRISTDTDLQLEDRIAFACTFLNDSVLTDFVKDLAEHFTSKGLLEGLILTGFGTEGIDLVQNYVDKTSDVQTASLLTALVLTREWSEDPRPHRWVEDYREVLDSWMLWEARAIFDVYNNRLKGGGPRMPRQIVATCTFCGKSIAHNASSQSVSGRGDKLLFPKTPNVSEIPKVMACSSCGKSLPRCALCQIHMGTPTNMGFVTGEMDDAGTLLAKKINPIEKWFTWCQSCRHGGHASHLAEWFREHSECAVTGCSCKCMMIESGCATVTKSRRRIATSN